MTITAEQDLVPAKITEELEIIELDGKRHFKLVGSDPPKFRSLVLDHNIDIQAMPSGEVYSLIDDVPGILLREVPSKPSPEVHRLQDVMIPGFRFKILR